MPEKNGGVEIQFAIDFGTTKTHIEYKSSILTEKGFDNKPDIPIWQSLIDVNERQDQIVIADNSNFEKELIPYTIDNNTITKFPFRTALTVNENLDFSRNITSFVHANCFLLFEMKSYPTYFNLKTRLKWSNYNNPEDKMLVRSFIESLLQLTLFKTLLLNGDPEKTRITWFYPVSIDTFEQGVLLGLERCLLKGF
jgi:hypothetical protein